MVTIINTNIQEVFSLRKRFQELDNMGCIYVLGLYVEEGELRTRSSEIDRFLFEIKNQSMATETVVFTLVLFILLIQATLCRD